jgi:hypothetical protein
MAPSADLRSVEAGKKTETSLRFFGKETFLGE